MKNVKHSLLISLVAVPALAQTDATFLLRSSNTVSPSSPTTTIEVWATWTDPSGKFLFSGTNYDLTASEVGWTNVQLVLGLTVPPLPPSPNNPGVIVGNTIVGAAIGQSTFCGIIGCPDDNPILLATYDWTTTNFTPRSVDLSTGNTSAFYVSTPGLAPPVVIVDLFPDEFTPGSGLINVVPAPAAWLALPLALPLIVARRRRRC